MRRILPAPAGRAITALRPVVLVGASADVRAPSIADYGYDEAGTLLVQREHRPLGVGDDGEPPAGDADAVELELRVRWAV